MVPARAGSQGLPDKNVRLLLEKPLLSYSITAGIESKYIDEVFINSDSKEYLQVGVDYGATAFQRGPILAQNETSMKAVVQDFIATMSNDNRPADVVVVLYPTYPLRQAKDVDAFMEEFLGAGGQRPLLGFTKPKTHPYLCYSLDENKTPIQAIDFDVNQYYRRQQYPTYLAHCAWACVLPSRSVNRLNAQLIADNTIGYEIKNEQDVVDVDTLIDFELAELRLRKRLDGQ